MNSLLERPNFLSVLILLGVFTVGVGYMVITINQRPEMESFTVGENYEFPFNFDRLSNIAKLPKDLKEISGLTAWKNPDEVLAIQDEDGELFVVNTESGQVKANYKFNKDRDYEGIARNGDRIYVLETDGDIHYFTFSAAKDEYDADKFETDFSYRNDTEGICYDTLTKSLLIVPKEQELNPASQDDTRRGIYSFDLKSFRLNPQPTYHIDEMEVGKVVFQKEKKYIVKPSGIAIDPITKDIYVISSVGKILIVINRDNEIKHVELLESETFRQPEGITFNEAGDLYISSEGRGGTAIIATLRRGKTSANQDTKDK